MILNLDLDAFEMISSNSSQNHVNLWSNCKCTVPFSLKATQNAKIKDMTEHKEKEGKNQGRIKELKVSVILLSATLVGGR